MIDADAAVLGLGAPTGDAKSCSFVMAQGDVCEVVAIVHAVVTVDAENIASCQHHWPLIREAVAPLQWHPVDENCGVPGSAWNFDENRCEFEPFTHFGDLLTDSMALESRC